MKSNWPLKARLQPPWQSKTQQHPKDDLLLLRRELELALSSELALYEKTRYGKTWGRRTLQIVITQLEFEKTRKYGLRSSNIPTILEYSVCPMSESESPDVSECTTQERLGRKYKVFVKRSKFPKAMEDSSGHSAGQALKARKEAERQQELSKKGADYIPYIFLIRPVSRRDAEEYPQTMVMQYIPGETIGTRFRKLSGIQENLLTYMIREHAQKTLEQIEFDLFSSPVRRKAVLDKYPSLRELSLLGKTRFESELKILGNLGFLEINKSAVGGQGKGTYVLINPDRFDERYVQDSTTPEDRRENPAYGCSKRKAIEGGLQTLVDAQNHFASFKFETDGDLFLEPTPETLEEKMHIFRTKINTLRQYQRKTRFRSVQEPDSQFMQTYLNEILHPIYESDPKEVVQGDANIFNFICPPGIQQADRRVMLLDLFHMRRDNYLSDFVDLLQSARVLTGLSQEEYTGLMNLALDKKGITDETERAKIFTDILPRMELHRAFYVLASIAGTASKRLEKRSMYEKQDSINQFGLYKQYILELLDNPIYSPGLRKGILDLIQPNGHSIPRYMTASNPSSNIQPPSI